MPKEYIEREALIEELKRRDFLPVIVKHAIEAVTAADVAEVRHGKWIQPHWKNSNYCCNCSECGREAMHADYQWDKNGIYPICPNCGAKMDKEQS